MLLNIKLLKIIIELDVINLLNIANEFNIVIALKLTKEN